MKRKTIFQCEICGSWYDLEDAALWCEAQTPPECPVKPGDHVEVYERYGSPSLDVVVGVEIAASYLMSAIMSWTGTQKQWEEFLERIKERPVVEAHTWLIETEEHHQLGKDDCTITRKIDWGSVRLPGANVSLKGDKW